MIRVAIAGLGKIARDQHVPVIAASPDFELVAVAIAASAVGGTANRWLAGATDLFVERG